MSLFMSSGPSPEEIKQASAIKIFLTQQLKDSVHHLQEQHINNEEPILSEEAANAVCSVLEAIFLHGLKASFSKKLSNYLNGFNNDKDFSFWGFVSKFSHRDTVSHLNHLGQITTEVGMCRAWVRLALNDGLFESYLDVLLRDKKSLVTYYRRLAYLRDPEQPSIMKSYLQGLLNFQFQLSYNSSVLNLWTVTPLTLAGLVDVQANPQPVIRSTQAVEAMPNDDMHDVVAATASQNRVVTRIAEVSSGPSVEPISQQQPRYSPVVIVENDMDDIRKMMADTSQRKKSDDDNSSTATSQVSHPDPVDVRQFPHTSLSPHEPHMGREFFGTWPDSGVGSDSSTKRINVKKKGKQKKKKKSAKIVEKREQSCDDDNNKTSAGNTGDTGFGTITEGIDGSMLNNEVVEIPEPENQSLSESKQQVPEKDVGGNKGTDSLEYSLDKPDKPGNVGENCLVDIVNEDIMVQNDRTTQVLAGFNGDTTSIQQGKEENVATQEDKDDQELLLASGSIESHDPDTSNRRASQGSGFKDYTPGKSEPLQPQLSSVTAMGGRVEEAEDASEADLSGNLSQDNEELSSSYPVRQQSNSLSHSLMQGWSSEFQEEEEEEASVYNPYSTAYQQQAYLVTDSGVGADGSGVEVADSATEALFTDSSPSKSGASKSTQEFSESIYNEEYEVLPEATELSSQVEDAHHMIFKEQFGVLTVERGLDVQNYQCHGCKRSVGMFFCQPRVCSFDGAYYCYECHENEEYYIPAKIVHNWDFRQHLVCKGNLCLLRQFEDAPLLNVNDINPRLYDHVTEMAEAKELRRQLRYLKAYLFTCKQSVAEEFRQQIWPKEYLYDDIHSYSLLDLLQITNGQFAVSLKKIIKFASKHVYECRLCSQKGFICEICNNPKVIYPFQLELTKKCDSCEAVYHKACKTEFVPCPKCQRLMERNIHLGKRPEKSSMDYALAPAQMDSRQSSSSMMDPGEGTSH